MIYNIDDKTMLLKKIIYNIDDKQPFVLFFRS